MSNEIEHKTDLLLKKAQIAKNPLIDHARALVIASLNFIPSYGGAIASLAETYIPKKKEERILDFIHSLSVKIEQISDKVDTKVINTDEFAFIFERTFRGVIDNYQQEKIDCYKAVFINALTDKGSLKEEEKEIFLNILSNLTVRHLRILAVIKKCSKDRGSLIEAVQKFNPGYEKDDILSIMESLRTYGLVHLRGTVLSYDINANFNQLTSLGQKFLEFITLEW